MSDITPARYMIQQESTAPQAAVSEDTMTKIGANNNFINLYQLPIYDFKANGAYNTLVMPANGFDGLMSFPFAWEIAALAIANGGLNGVSGTTELDLKWRAYNNAGSYTSIFSTTPKFTPSSTAFDLCFNGDSKTGFTAPVLSKTTFAAKDKVRLDILQVVSGEADFAGIKIFWRPI